MGTIRSVFRTNYGNLLVVLSNHKTVLIDYDTIVNRYLSPSDYDEIGENEKELLDIAEDYCYFHEII